jgi:3-oxoacyl-(acyl-carrier-protein) synthase
MVMKPRQKRVAITGVGVLTPAGIGKEAFWKNSLKGKSYTTSYHDFPDFQLKSRVVAKIDDFDAQDFSLTGEEVLRLGRPTQLAIAGTLQALTDAGVDLAKQDQFNLERVGVCIGNAIADTPFSEQQYLAVRPLLESPDANQSELYPLVDEHLYFKAMFSCISTEIAGRFGIMGPVLTMATGCTSGIDAIGCGFEMIRDGEADLVISGATEAPLTLMTMASFDVVGATSKKNHPPHKASSPFDLTRSGFVLAEGCGICILEEWEHARRRHAHIYAEVLSFASNNNAVHMTNLDGDGTHLAQTIDMALKDAGLEPGMIGYINAHGSSTQQNDLYETNAYKKAFGGQAYRIPISSTKSIVGHPLGAASAVEMVHCCLALEKGIIPPTLNLDTPDPQCDLDYVPNRHREKQVDVLLTAANGFSGIHSVMILARGPRPAARAAYCRPAARAAYCRTVPG